MTHVPPDFKEFLRLPNAHQVEYFLIGGYALPQQGYPRATADMDIRIAANTEEQHNHGRIHREP